MSWGIFIRYSVCLMVAMTGCGSPEKSTSTTAPAATTNTEEVAPLVTMSSEGMKLVMYDQVPNGNDTGPPTFIIDADLGVALDDNSSKLTQPNAIIFTEDQEEIHLGAQAGVFDKQTETATLDGGVTLSSPRLHLTMESIVWDNLSRVGHSDVAIQLDTDWAGLTASGMTLTPETGTLIMTQVSGTITLGASQ